MPLHLYDTIYESGSVPRHWKPMAGLTIKYPVRNKSVLEYLRVLLSGKWQKVIKDGTIGEVHYFEHESGKVAGVKYFTKQSYE